MQDPRPGDYWSDTLKGTLYLYMDKLGWMPCAYVLPVPKDKAAGKQ